MDRTARDRVTGRPVSFGSDRGIPSGGRRHGALPIILPVIVLLVIVLTFLSGCGNDRDGSISASGTIEVVDVTVSAKVPGELERRYVDEGSIVRAGDTLATIRHLTAPLELRQARAALAAAAAAEELLRRGAREEDLRQARATMENLEAELRRAEELHAARLISDRERDEARTRFTVARETHEKLRNGPLPEELERARAQADEVRARVALIEKRLEDAVALAPVDGVVTLRAAETGELLQQGSAIVRISVLDRVRLVIYVREADLGRIRLGDPAKVSIDSYPDRTFDGKVIYISPVAEFTPKNVQTKEERVKLSFAVKIEVENPGGELKPGMPADAQLGDAPR